MYRKKTYKCGLKNTANPSVSRLRKAVNAPDSGQ